MTALLRFLIPVFLGNMFQQFYNMADTMIVGRFVSADALAAVGSTGTIMFLILGASIGMASGFSVLTAQSFGAGDMRRVRHSVANGMILALIFSVVLTAVSVLAMPSVLRLMNTPENIYEDAKTYIIIICYGLVTSFFYNLASSFLRAIGNSKVPLYFLIFSACLNVVLDLLCIIGFHMGVAGAAIATVIAQGVSAVICFLYIFRKVPMLRPEREDWRLNAADTSNQLKMGIPMALQFAITASGTMVMQSAINLFGSVAVASYTAASKLQNLLTQGLQAMAPAMATFAGQNYGKGNIAHLKKGVRAAMVISTCYAIAAGLLSIGLVRPTLQLFFAAGTDLAELLPWAKTYLRISAMFYIPLGYIFIFRNAMQGCGYGLLPMLGGVVELVARLITSIIAMHTMSYFLAVASDPMAWLCAGIYTMIAWLFISRKLSRDPRFQALE